MPNINVNNYKHINLENEEKKIKILAKISKDYSIKIWEKNQSLGKVKGCTIMRSIMWVN